MTTGDGQHATDRPSSTPPEAGSTIAIAMPATPTPSTAIPATSDAIDITALTVSRSPHPARIKKMLGVAAIPEGPRRRRGCAPPCSAHFMGMSRHPPLRRAPWCGSLAACSRFGEALDPLARHHHPPPPAALSAGPTIGRVLTRDPCWSHPANPSRALEKFVIPQCLDPSRRNPFSKDLFREPPHARRHI